MNPRRSSLGAVGSISFATLLSRVLGLVRDQVQSFYFGAGAVTDAYLAAFRIPNLLRDLFAEGALSSALVPTFAAELEKRGEEAAWRLARRVMSALLLILGLLTVLLALFAPGILQVYAAGFPPGKMELATSMTRVLSPFLLFVALAAVAMGALNARGRFFLPALAPAWFNVASIGGVILLYPVLRSIGWNPGLALAFAAMLGGILQFLAQVPALRAEGFRFRFDLRLRDPVLRRVAHLMVPATFGLAATQINILVDTVIASFMGDAPITWLYLAFRLMQFPIGLFGVAIATANLAFVSRDAARGDLVSLRGNLAGSLRVAALLTLPATAGLIALRVPIVRVLFEHGEFTQVSTMKTSAAVLCYALGLYAYSVTKIQVPTFYALGDTRRPVVASAVSVAVKIAANFLFIAALPRFGVDAFLGLALSTSLAAWVNLFVLSGGLRGRVGRLSAFGVVPVTLKLAALSVAMGAACAGLHSLLQSHAAGAGTVGDIARLSLAIGVGIGVTLVGVRLLRVREGTELLRRLRSIASRNPGE